MNKELALRTFCYLIGYYKTHDETIINTQEIEAIEFILKINEELEQQCKKQKEVIGKAIETLEKGITFCENDSQGIYDKCNIAISRDKRVLDILKEVSE